MNRSDQQWNALRRQLQMFKKENQALKQSLQEMKGNNFEDQGQQIRSTFQFTSKNAPLKLQSRCNYCGQYRPIQKTKEQIVNEFQSWSKKLSIDLFKKKDLQIRRTHVSQNRDNPSSLQVVEQQVQAGLLQKLCLFGPNQSKTLQMSSRKMNLPHQLYYPQVDKHFSLYQSYGFSLYPEQVDVKVIREKNKTIEIDRVIFRKSLKYSDCKLIIFQSKQQFCLPENPIMRQYNPFSTIYCVSLDFIDYLCSDKPYIDLDRSSCLTQDKFQELTTEKNDKVLENVLTVPQVSKKENNVYGQQSVFKSIYCISLMSYYPFIDFFCQFLLQLINHIKIKRIEEHANSGQNYKKIDIQYVIQQMKKINSQLSKLFTLKMDYGSKIEYELGQKKIKRSFDNIREEMSRDWAYRMLRLLDRDTLYQIYCMVLQQQSIVFFGENSYVVTFMIYLFVGLLIHPFSYPHTIVSSVFDIDHLQTPFIAIMGLNKPNAWMKQNEEYFLQKAVGKIIIHVQVDQTKIKSKKKQKYAKSQRLKKIFNNFYKKVEKLQINTKHKDILTRQITKTENALTQQLLADLQNFYNQELIKYMPKKQIIDSIKKQLSASNDNQATVSVKLIKQIEQYIIQSRKGMERDPFIDSILQKQIFSVYVTIKYDIL